MLAVTGVWLWFRYVPSASSAWPGTHVPATDESWIRTTHRLVSFLVVALAVTALALVIGRRVRSGVRGILAATGVLVTALAAAITGYLLPWDQLALWAVTVGSDIRGVQAPFRSEVKYILIGSHEVSPGTYRFWALKPTPYPIPDDGPVGRLLRAVGRSPVRASHLHFMVTAPAYRRLVTHIFVEGDDQLTLGDSVFGVRDSLVKTFERQPAGTPTPDGRDLGEQPWTRTRFDIVLAPAQLPG